MKTSCIGRTIFAVTRRSKSGYIYVVEHKVIRNLGGIHTLALSKEGRTWWAIMKEFNLPPNDYHIREMTLEQRNYCVFNMNQDARLKEGKTGDVAADSTADKWLNAPEKDFHVIPTTVPGGKKTVLKSLRKKVGLAELERDDKIWQNVKKQAPIRHAYRVGKAKAGQNEANKALKAKAKAYKKAGIDKSNSWNNLLDNDSKDKFDI